ncbi:hypothetical protein F0000_16630 [Aquimarina sp. RZ0]|nr:hypothetical protein F0000_16630 [Aquimarina sp. RZ0]
MRSYIQAPTAHAAAVKNPKMLGGPFIDYDGKRVDEITMLKDETLEKQKDLIAFNNAVKELDELLKSKAKGYSLDPLYNEVPEQLKGYVDVLFLGMECDDAPLSWLYGPLMTEPLTREKYSSRRLAGSNFQRGKGLVDAFHAKEVYVYAMGQEPWLEFISSIKYTDESNPIVQSDKLIEYCKTNGIISERLFGEKEILYNKLASELIENDMA